MKQLCILLMVLISNSISGQISVRNSNYLFVSDRVIFSEDYVNLNETDSRFYLRNEAQLIQGNGITGNSGIGELSIFQTGTANHFAYNYWCSPIGNNSSSLGNENARVSLIDDATGLITSSDALFTTNLDGISSPLTISNRWLYTFVVSDEYAEWNALDEDSTILPGLGFTMKGIDAGGQLYDFRGKPNNGTISNSIAANQYTLIGNPYPSAIDALLFIHDTDNTNIDVASAPFTPTTTGVLYFWEQQPTDHYTANYIGGYATYTISSGGVESFTPATFYAYDVFGNEVNLPPPGANGSKIAKRYIPVGQGFMVEGASSTSTGSLVYVKNSHRVYEKESDGNSYFFRNDENASTTQADNIEYNAYGFNIVPDDFKRFRLNVTFNQTIKRQLLHNFHDSATDGFDYGLEAPSSEDFLTDAWWVLDDMPYVTQAHNFDIEKRIPLIVNVEHQQLVEFSIFDVQNFDSAQPIFLHDIDNQTYTDLRVQNYNVNLTQGNYNNRFEITFAMDTNLGVSKEEINTIKIIQNNETATMTILNHNNLDIESVDILDVSGKLICHYRIKAHELERIQMSTGQLSSAVYLIKIVLKDKGVITDKIVVSH
nr:hypothetical protein [uncultured Psychroserpens sp.]